MKRIDPKTGEAVEIISTSDRMKRQMLMKHAALAETIIAECKGHVERQQELVKGLAREGHDTRSSQELLKLFEQTLAAHIKDRDQILQELIVP